ncbi:MAG: chitobiase/beta-hexosaminidase C-terminal domain-containing protein, partial [Muribaculaceae bacterium]|nr:chitobiase/beta-hexosaminidase C-terminal domain-containing protein [Muribaculaceae bacterium]
LIAMVALAFGYASAATESFAVADMKGLQTTNQDFTVTFGNYTLALAKVGGATAPVYNETYKDLRTYAGNTLTLTTSGAAMTKVVFNISVQGMKRLTDVAASTGSVTVDASAKTVTWTGPAGEVVFTVGEKATYGSDGAAKAGQLDFDAVEIETGGSVVETVATPKFSVAGGTYHGAQTVAINCGTSGASIYYTLDGTTPSASSTAYTAPLSITATTTVKAIAVKGDKKSDVAEATYTIEAATAVANIAAYQNVDDDTYVQFSNPVNVLAHNSKNLYVKDATGYAFIYGDPLSGKTYKNGDVIPAGFTGKKITFNGQPELSVYPTDGFQAASGNSPIEPETITTAQVSDALFGHYVLIKGAKVSYADKTITDAAGSAQVRTGMGGYGSSTDATKEFDVTAIIGTAKDGDNIITVVLPVKLTEAGGDQPVVDGMTIAEFQQAADDAVVTFKNPVTVQAVSGSRMFVKDETGYMLVYGNTGKTYAQGNVIPAGFSGTKTTYDGEPELKTPFAGFKDATSTVEVKAEALTGEAMMAHANFGHYVVAKNVTIDATASTLTLENGEVVKFYNNMGANMPSDFAKKYDVYGIVGSYGKTNTIYQLLTTKITEAGGGEVDVQEVANVAALYNLGKGVNGKITGAMTAIYQNGSYLYVKSDDEYALVYGRLTNTFENGDQIQNAVANWTLYNGAKQLVPTDETFVASGKGAAIEPTEIALEEVGTDMVHNYLLIKNATITATETANTYEIADETMEGVKLFAKFSGVEMPETLEGKTFDVKCFVTIFKEEVELYPVEIKDNAPVPPALKGDVNNDGTVDVSDLNVLLNIMLGGEDKTEGRSDVTGDGTIDISDVNAVINIMLGAK